MGDRQEQAEVSRILRIVEEIQVRQGQLTAQIERLERHMDAALTKAIADVKTLFGDLSNAITALREAQSSNANVTAEEQAAAADLETLVSSGHQLLAPAVEAAQPSAEVPPTP
jgi:chromosome segregation ATPase